MRPLIAYSAAIYCTAWGVLVQLNISRSTLLRRYLGRQLLRAATRLAATGDSAPMFCLPADRIGQEVALTHTFEKELTDAALRIYRQCAPEADMAVALDIGGNIGTHAMRWLEVASRVIVFEPNPEVRSVLQANALRFGAERICVQSAALSDREGMADLEVGAGNLGSGSLEYRRGAGAESVFSVSLQKGDDLTPRLLKHGERIGLIKIDVEGHEPQVIAGLADTITAHQPVIIFEANNAAELAGCVTPLRTLGYDRFVMLRKTWEHSPLRAFLCGPKVTAEPLEWRGHRLDMVMAIPR